LTKDAKTHTVKIFHENKEAGTLTIETQWKSLKKDKNAKDVVYNG